MGQADIAPTERGEARRRTTNLLRRPISAQLKEPLMCPDISTLSANIDWHVTNERHIFAVGILLHMRTQLLGQKQDTEFM